MTPTIAISAFSDNMSQTKTIRPNNIDYAKVIMIYAVVLGHYTYALGLPFQNVPVWNLMHMITLFHMPFFFIVSGMLFKDRGVKDTINRGWDQLLIPYFLMCGIAIFLMLIISAYSGSLSLREIASLFVGYISANDMIKLCSGNWASALWFCYALFIVKVLKSWTLKYKLGGVFSVVLYLLAIAIMYIPNKIPFRIDAALIGYLFFSIGYYCKQRLMQMTHIRFTLRLVILMVAVLILFIAAYINLDFDNRQGLSINANYFGFYPPLFIVSGVSGTVMILILSTFLEKCKSRVILQISNGTIVILGFHWTVYILMFRWWLQSSSVLIALLIALANLIACYCLILLASRFFPALLGNRRLS